MKDNVTQLISEDGRIMECTCLECGYSVEVKDVFKTYECRYCGEGVILWEDVNA